MAVTCVAGNVTPQVAENTRAVLELVGRPDVEVALGREAPLVRELVTTPETHGRGASGTRSCPGQRPLSARFGPSVMVYEARRRPGELRW